MIVLVGRTLGLEIFPKVDAGRFQLRMRAPDGTRIEETEQAGASRRSSTIEQGGRARTSVEISVGYVGLDPVELPDQRHLPVDGRARGGDPPGRLEGRARRSTSSGSRSGSATTLASEMPGVRFSFEPADIVSEVMSFGSPTPVEVARQRPEPRRRTGPTPRRSAPSWPRSRRSATSSTASRSTTRRSASRSTASGRA